VKKSIPTKTSRWARIKSFQEIDCFRFGAGEMPWRRRTLPPSDRIDYLRTVKLLIVIVRRKKFSSVRTSFP
jgi:hypothetical protein